MGFPLPGTALFTLICLATHSFELIINIIVEEKGSTRSIQSITIHRIYYMLR